MTKLIGILVVVLVIWGGYELFEVWDRYDTDKDLKAKEAEAAANFTPESLPGMPYDLQKTYEIAQKNGATGIGNWLKAYGAKVQDPRKAWIELDYVVAIAAKDPVEAKKVFADVKARVPASSPVYKRVKELESTYD
jgi:hypothetical protein